MNEVHVEVSEEFSKLEKQDEREGSDSAGHCLRVG